MECAARVSSSSEEWLRSEGERLGCKYREHSLPTSFMKVIRVFGKKGREIAREGERERERNRLKTI